MIQKKTQTHYRTIDLTGAEGNAFYLIGTAMKLARQLNLSASEIQQEMTSGDYENLVNVFDKYFGDYVILLR
jgi:hypothetical protein